jgi:acetyl coenzyme A synthetase (ADP forming)-like protein
MEAIADATREISPYPAYEESDVVLRTGATLRLRPARPGDEAAMARLFDRLPANSLFYRFTALRGRTGPAGAAALCDIDYDDRFTIVAETNGRFLGIAVYARDPERRDAAEVAFVVEDAVQGKGLGTRMLERLAEIARSRGIALFTADVPAGSRRALEVFRDCGFVVDQHAEADAVRVAVSIRPTPAFEEKAAERSELAAAASMRRLFYPRSVAVVGAARERGKIGAEILHNLVSAGFTGEIHPVNPNADSIEGRKCYPNVRAIPGELDLAVISVPMPLVDAAVDDCIAKGVSAIVVITAGFGETGEEGREREARLLEKVRAAGIRMVGPNCMGLLNTDPDVRLNATFAPAYPPAGRVALSSQSGALGLALLDYASDLNLGISTFVSVGNKADVSSNDLIQYWAADSNTDVILLYLESFGQPGLFGRLARRITRRKPIVAVKAGRSRAGARAASSHTGALAETDTVVGALLRQAGVIRTETLEELFDVAALLAHQPAPRGRRVAIVTNAGGPGILAADACEARALELPALRRETAEALRSFLPAAASVANPVDMLASAPPDHYARTLRAVLADPGVDSVLVIFIPPIAADTDAVARAIAEEAKAPHDKTLLTIFMSAKGAPALLRPVPSYAFPESAAAALARAVQYGEWRTRPEGAIPEFRDLRLDHARAIVDRSLAAGGGWLGPADASALISDFGIAAAPLRVAGGSDEAVSAAEEIGFPVAIKAVGPAILHKTEVGGVRLNLRSPDEVRAAAEDLRARLGAELTGILVQGMVPGGVEVVAGIVQDPTFGALIMYGSGGTLVELLADVAFRLHPITDADAVAMLEEVRGTALLRGFRGAPPGDETALRELLLRLSALAEACPEVQEMDINPVKVLERGVRVVDARVRIGKRPPRRRSRRIAY